MTGARGGRRRNTVKTKTEQASKQKFELQFVKLINENSDKVKALSALSMMTETEKLELIENFIEETK